MDIRTAITSWAGAGAAENARRSLTEWTRAQDEVAALLDRLDRLDRRDAADGEPTTHSAA
jgi:hypothetical protein